MRLDELDYRLPKSQIAQRPLQHRADSKLLLLERSSGRYEGHRFAELPELLRGNELLVVNNARVIPARLFGRRLGVHADPSPRKTRGDQLSGSVEVFLARKIGEETWEALVRPGRKLGHVPLPPYIDREDEPADRERYQTVFASRPGAIAAPTAGLHFTREILDQIRERGCEICEITLDVGLGTFQPIHTETLEAHVMQGEHYEISEDTARRIASA